MTEAPDYSKRRFLIVDDEPFMLSLVERALRHLKAGAIVKAADGAEALRSIKDNFSQVDCIISDFNMKPVNGLQLLQSIRMGLNQRIPRDQAFIMLTAFGETDVVKAAIMLDVNGYLVKPVAPDKLAQTLERTLKKATDLKGVEYYRSVNVGATTALNDAPEKSSKSWIILSKQNAHNSQGLKEKLDRFHKENATQDGLEDIKIKNRRQCDLGELKADMLLAEDVEGEEGKILLRKGTMLTANMVTRLRELAVESQSRNYVWIGDLA